MLGQRTSHSFLFDKYLKLDDVIVSENAEGYQNNKVTFQVRLMSIKIVNSWVFFISTTLKEIINDLQKLPFKTKKL